MLLHVVADYGPGDLAFAEVTQALARHLPDARVVVTCVRAFDSLAAGFCAAQLALTDGPAERAVFSNVAPRADSDDPRPGNAGEQLVACRTEGGVWVVGVNSRHAFSFLAPEVDAVREVAVGKAGSQFRSRDLFPEALGRVLRREEGALGGPVPDGDLPPAPDDVVVFTDGYGNVKTSLPTTPAEPGTAVRVRFGDVEAEATIGGGTFEVPEGEMSLAPGSSGWTRRDGTRREFCELLLRGGSAAARFGHPPSGTPVRLTVG